jgi:hypothetical protein
MKFSLVLIAATVAMASALDKEAYKNARMEEMKERKMKMKEKMMELRDGQFSNHDVSFLIEKQYGMPVY